MCCYSEGLLISSLLHPMFLFISHTLKDYSRHKQRKRMRSHTAFLLWRSVQGTCESSSCYCRQTGIVFAGLFTTTADSRTGKHERLRKCVTQFAASSLPCVVDRAFSVKTKNPTVGVGLEEERRADSTDSQRYPCLHRQCQVAFTDFLITDYLLLPFSTSRVNTSRHTVQGVDTLTGTP